jgi:hypothetical protein
MNGRLVSTVVFAGLLALGNMPPACADPVPAPPQELKDYEGKGIIQIDIPPTPAAGDKAVNSGINFWFPFRQAYVRPDRLLMDIDVLGNRQLTLIQGSIERSYTASTNYIIERSFKNVDPAAPSPMPATQLSMATYARVLREVTTGKLLPPENLKKLAEQHTARIAELQTLRMELVASKKPGNLEEFNAAASEMARLRDDLQQMEIRRAHPCHVMEFQNKDLIENLFARGLMGDNAKGLLVQGKTKIWITQDEGLPIRIETTANDGRVALYFCFTELTINAGTHPNEVLLGAPSGTRIFRTSVDVSLKNWEERAEKDLNDQVTRYEQEQRAQRERAQAPLYRGKSKR